MAKLPKYTLQHDEKRDDWKLVNDATDETVRRYETKSDATSGGTLKSAVGPEGGSVKIQREDGRFQEERTYPKSADPKKSPG